MTNEEQGLDEVVRRFRERRDMQRPELKEDTLFRTYVLTRINHHSDSGNLLRYLGWSFVELFTRRGRGHYAPSLR